MDIMDFITEIPITREELVKLTGLPDRQVRELIEQKRHEGVLILNLQDGKGYFISNDIDKLERQYRQNEHRAKSVYAQQKHLRRRLKEAGRAV